MKYLSQSPLEYLSAKLSKGTSLATIVVICQLCIFPGGHGTFEVASSSQRSKTDQMSCVQKAYFTLALPGTRFTTYCEYMKTIRNGLCSSNPGIRFVFSG